jgi:hypothetical protein
MVGRLLHTVDFYKISDKFYASMASRRMTAFEHGCLDRKIGQPAVFHWRILSLIRTSMKTLAYFVCLQM